VAWEPAKEVWEGAWKLEMHHLTIWGRSRKQALQLMIKATDAFFTWETLQN
jgi:hypothetical protein